MNKTAGHGKNRLITE